MKKLTLCLTLLCLTAALAVPASALEYTIDAPGGPEYAKATSVEPVVTADRGEAPNEDLSKNAALVPPTFGSPTASAQAPYPSLLGAAQELTHSAVPPFQTAIAPLDCGLSTGTLSTAYTAVTSGLYYANGSLGTLKIPSLGVDVKVYQGTDSTQLDKGAAHFMDTSIWDGNVCIAGHNRGTNCYFGEIHTLSLGDKITLTTKLGTRTYAVTSVTKISEIDNSMLAAMAENCITLYTCVRGQSAYRWCVRAVETV